MKQRDFSKILSGEVAYNGKIFTDFCQSLKAIVRLTNEPLEGNCLYKHNSFEIWDVLVAKRANYQILAENKTQICEIGFNAGHSLLTMLLINPTAHYVIFDIGIHKYSQPCYQYLTEQFPDTTIEIFWGDSRETVPTYCKRDETFFEVVHIDGSHQPKVYSQDWECALVMTVKGGIIIFDDTNNHEISKFVDAQIQRGLVRELHDYNITAGYKHRILMKL